MTNQNNTVRGFLGSSMLVGLGLVGGMGGCQDNVKAPGYVQQDPLPAEQYPRVDLDASLQTWLVSSTAPRVVPGPPMAVTYTCRAKTDVEELNVQYRYLWFDKNGAPLNDNPTWQYKRMPSRSEVFFTGNATDSTAVDWRLQIRPAR
jgi:uncharacterized protein YcfL